MEASASMMVDWVLAYATTIWMLGVMDILMLVQLLVVDVAGIRVGHVPGSAVTGDHGQFFFRAARAHANTNESVAIFILAALFGILLQASPGWIDRKSVV